MGVTKLSVLQTLENHVQELEKQLLDRKQKIQLIKDDLEFQAKKEDLSKPNKILMSYFSFNELSCIVDNIMNTEFNRDDGDSGVVVIEFDNHKNHLSVKVEHDHSFMIRTSLSVINKVVQS